MQEFDTCESELLKFSVYVYTDSRGEEPCYVGKGNRAFNHLTDGSESVKVSRIREIREAGWEPRVEVLAFGLDERTAFKVEAAAIDLTGTERHHQCSVGAPFEAVRPEVDKLDPREACRGTTRPIRSQRRAD